MLYRDIEIFARTHEAISCLRILNEDGSVDWEAEPEVTIDLDEQNIVWYEADLPLRAGEQFHSVEQAKKAVDDYYKENTSDE